jgi:hypothetical protein
VSPLPDAIAIGCGIGQGKVFNVDKLEVELACPICGFYATVTIRQIRLEDAVICGGCKTNIQLVDAAGDIGRFRALVRRSLEGLAGGSIKLTLRL